jgi:hypothetical protein
MTANLITKLDLKMHPFVSFQIQTTLLNLDKIFAKSNMTAKKPKCLKLILLSIELNVTFA